MELKIKFDLNPDEIQKEINERCKKETQRALDNAINQLFRGRGHYGQSEGPLHLIIRNRLEDYLLSDKFSAKLDQWIEENIDAALNEGGEKIIKWAARKKLFTTLEKGLKVEGG